MKKKVGFSDQWYHWQLLRWGPKGFEDISVLTSPPNTRNSLGKLLLQKSLTYSNFMAKWPKHIKVEVGT